MIQIIRKLCKNAGCQPKDLVVEWTPTQGVRVIGTNSQGVKTAINVLARLDHVAQAVWLCVNGQEHLYPQIQQQQAAIDIRVKEWMVQNAAQFEEKQGNQTKKRFTIPKENVENVEQDWHELDTVEEIMRAFPRHPSADDIIDLYQRNKNLKSSDLKALLEKHSR
jgi:hypothetical protein